jgi:hypothetical protein
MGRRGRKRSSEVSSPSTSPQNTEAPALQCHWCGVPLAEDVRCPQCGRRQVKVCSCGVELPPDATACPACGKEWDGVVKILRRRRRRGANGVGALRAAGLGVLIALVCTGLASALVAHLAAKSSTGPDLPEAPSERLGLAWKTVSDTLGGMREGFISRAGGALYIVLLGLVGAMVGVFFYLRSTGAFEPRHGDDLAPPGTRRRPR